MAERREEVWKEPALKKKGDPAGLRKSAMVRRDARTGVEIETLVWGMRVRTSAGFEGVGTEGEDVGGEAGLEERGFVGRYSGGGRLGRSGHRNKFLVEDLDYSKRYPRSEVRV